MTLSGLRGTRKRKLPRGKASWRRGAGIMSVNWGLGMHLAAAAEVAASGNARGDFAGKQNFLGSSRQSELSY